ncbi:MAG: aspartate aminotransferase family protein [Burkholderiaceae bacterium]
MNAPEMTASHLEPFWMPFTDNRKFKQSPRLVSKASGMYYTAANGKQILDGLATLWCVNAGHCHPHIVQAIQQQAGELDFASSFSMSHPLPFELAGRIADLAPERMNHVFFTNSGSEAVDTALKMAIAYQRLKGQGTRTRIIGRERAYHGVNMGGIAVSGMTANRAAYGHAMVLNTDHLAHTHDLTQRAFVRGSAEHGAGLADELEQRLIPLHGADNIAAVIVEPVAGAGGVLVPPVGYLQRLRDICTKHGILLIFDEVITGWGRLGKTFAAEHFGVTPDLMTFAKGVTSAAVPLGGVIASDEVYSTFMNTDSPGVEFFHGYTYSGHPLACAAALATLDVYRDENLLEKASGPLGQEFEDRLHALANKPHVVDCRNQGFIGAIELAPRDGKPGVRAFDVFERCWEEGVFVRPVGDAIGFCPPLIAESAHLDQMFSTVANVLDQLN